MQLLIEVAVLRFAFEFALLYKVFVYLGVNFTPEFKVDTIYY